MEDTPDTGTDHATARRAERAEKAQGYAAAAGAAAALAMGLYAVQTVFFSGAFAVLLGVGLTVCATRQFLVAAEIARARRENVPAPLDGAFAE